MDRKKTIVMLILSLLLVGLITLMISQFRHIAVPKKSEGEKISDKLRFVGDRIAQINVGDEFIISEHLLVMDDVGTLFEYTVVGEYDTNTSDIYYLKIVTQELEIENIETNFTLIVFSEDDYEY